MNTTLKVKRLLNVLRHGRTATTTGAPASFDLNFSSGQDALRLGLASPVTPSIDAVGLLLGSASDLFRASSVNQKLQARGVPALPSPL